MKTIKKTETEQYDYNWFGFQVDLSSSLNATVRQVTACAVSCAQSAVRFHIEAQVLFKIPVLLFSPRSFCQFQSCPKSDFRKNRTSNEMCEKHLSH